MRRALILCVGALALAVATAVTVAALWVALLDPTAHREEIAGWLSQALGRQVQVHGGLHLAVYPWLGLHIGQVTVADADLPAPMPAPMPSTMPGIANATTQAEDPSPVQSPALFATAHAAVVQMRLWPLLSRGDVELDRIILVDPVLRLRREANGTANWDDLLALAGGDPDVAAPTDAPAANPAARKRMRWSGVSIVNGFLVFDDAMRDQRLVLSQVHCITGAGTRFKIALQAQADSTRFGAGMLDLRGDCAVDVTSGNVRLSNATLAFDGQIPPDLAAGLYSERLGKAMLPVHLQTGLSLDTAAELAELHGANLFIGPERLQLDIRLEHFATPELRATGTIVRQAVPGTPHSRPWETAAFRTGFAADASRLSLQDFQMTSRHSVLNGNATLALGEEPALSLQLQAPRLNGDELAAAFATPGNGTLTADDVIAALAAGTIPGLPQPWNAMRVEADLRIEDVSFSGRRFQHTAAHAVLNRDGLDMRLGLGEVCGSAVQGQAGLNAKGLTVSLAAEKTSLARCPDLKGALAAGLVRSGEVTLSLNATAAGHSVETWQEDWELAASLNIEHGSLDWDRVQHATGVTSPAGNSDIGTFDALSVQGKAGSAKRARGAAAQDPQPVQADLSLRAKGLVVEAGKPVDVVLRSTGTAGMAPRSLALRSTSGLQIDLAAALPAGLLGKAATTATLKARGDWDASKARLSLSSLALKAHNVQATGSVTATRLGSSPVFQGSASIEPGTGGLATLCQALGLSLPATRKADAFSRVELNTDWKLEGDRLSLSRLTARVDDTTLRGDISCSLGGNNQTGPTGWRFQLQADRLTLDDYFAPSAADKSAAAEPARPWEGRSLQGLQLKGALHVGSLRLFDLHLEQLDMNLEGLPGQLRAEPFTCRLAGGRVKGHLSLLADRKQPGVQLVVGADMADFELNTVAQALGVGERLGGRTNLSFQLYSSGSSMQEHVSQLGGSASLKVVRGFYGYYRTIKPDTTPSTESHLIRRDRKPAPPEKPRRELTILPIIDAAGTMQFTDGVVRNSDSRITSDRFTATGSGWLSFPQERMEYVLQIDPRIIPSFPVIIKGAMDDPDVDDSQGGTLASAVTELTGTVFRTVLDVLTLPLKTLENMKPSGKP
ncbi:AsmA family protein [Megalodesulfovibrio paquesii]